MNANTAAAPRAARTLRSDTLFSQGRITVPSYDRGALSAGIVHFGVGGFHRAHQGVYLDEVAERGLSADWGVVGIGMRNRSVRDRLAAQDWLYTVAERSNDGDEARVVGVMREMLFAPDDPEAVLRRLTHPATRIVTLTITGEGYAVEPADAANPSVFAYLAAALERRRRAGGPGFSVMSCDNVPNNGSAARAATLASAAAYGTELGEWIGAHVSFPSSVVDRITPKSTPAGRSFVRREFGVDDSRPIITEPYTQWIVEDEFSCGRPPLEEVGVQFVDDVAPYELMKKRLLNGSHCALGYLGYLAGHRRTEEAMAEPVLRDYLRALMAREISPLLNDVPGIDLGAYQATLIARFSNARIGDQLSRLCERGSTKMGAYLLPSIEDSLARGRTPELLTLAVAAWFRYLQGSDLDGGGIDVIDPRAARLTRLARLGGCDPRPLLAERAVFGSLGESKSFVEALASASRLLERRGALSAIDALCPSTPLASAA